MRTAGILMPVASLPSKSGVGDFGENAYRFVDELSEMGMGIWQILPLNPLGYGNSPYQPYSSFAGDELYVDLTALQKESWITSEIINLESQPEKIEYNLVREYKHRYLREAFENFQMQEEKEPAYIKFLKMDWVYGYGVFYALKKQNDMKCWNEWPKEQQDWILDKKYDISHLVDEIQYQIFLQFEFWKQWKRLKEYANQKNIQIMGDVPFYVGIDSLDVWTGREDFLLDAEGKPSFIAGVPPDYFSETGLRWGNPIYNWENMKKDQYKFWVKRLEYSSQLYDVIRIDHFRAFDTYWKIPASCRTAEEGDWIEAPGYEVLDTIIKKIPGIHMVAEDLGDLRPEVLKLRDHFNLAGMNIAEFSVLNKKSAVTNQLIYTGTHDNQTVKGWYHQAGKSEKKKIRRRLSRLGGRKWSVSWKMIAYICGSSADIAIIPMADFLERDDSARLNTPGTVGSPNWEWKLQSLDGMKAYRKRIQNILSRTRR
ncbi:MAG TPA: 4-alpha-glucanotransferase [Candidatus Pelethocola excrementipullorum]|nr:4-alpha-glucanotransferase [Candidatus Pelethocola excrementipullorum]